MSFTISTITLQVLNAPLKSTCRLAFIHSMETDPVPAETAVYASQLLLTLDPSN